MKMSFIYNMMIRYIELLTVHIRVQDPRFDLWDVIGSSWFMLISKGWAGTVGSKLSIKCCGKHSGQQAESIRRSSNQFQPLEAHKKYLHLSYRYTYSSVSSLYHSKRSPCSNAQAIACSAMVRVTWVHIPTESESFDS